jgi:hypothetical protein
MHHPAWELVAAQIDHEEPAPGHARPQMPVTGDGERGHTLAAVVRLGNSPWYF